MRLKRIFSWWDLEQHKDGVGYQAYQAMIALGSGGWNGLGLGNGRQKLGFVPEDHTDFILSIIGEELGLMATLFILLAFVIIVICGIYIALNARDTFGFLLGTGITLLIGLQAAINIGVVTSALPNKGLPLPFISYGGSNLHGHVDLCGNFVQHRAPRPGALKKSRCPSANRRTSLRPIHMTQPGAKTPFVAIACGGTGGHLFPGLAVAAQLTQRGCAVALLISPKEVDQQAVKSAHGVDIVTLPAVGLQNRNYFSFARSFWQSWCAARKIFKSRPPHAVLAMGGFTSAPPVLAAKKFGARTFLHESNTIPGRANRFLARFVDEAFVGFPEAAARLRARKVTPTGTPVRPQFSAAPRHREPDTRNAVLALGLDPDRPTILVMGGSQGASGINEMILATLPCWPDTIQPGNGCISPARRF